MTSSSPMRIDAHHHLWRYRAAEYEWITPEMAPLRHDFLEADLLAELKTAGVSGTVAVQARQTVQETDWLLAIARESAAIRGVVGWLPLADPHLETLLDRFTADTHLKGLRHVVQAEAPGFLDHPHFNDGIKALTRRGLTYDLLISWNQLEESLRFVSRHPQQVFVIDHLAKPAFTPQGFELWAEQIRQFARRDNVNCKISGMVTEITGRPWSDPELEPYLDVALETFGSTRLMVGTDWPVLTTHCTYAQWWRTVEAWMAPVSSTERDDMLAGTATRVYSLGNLSQGNLSLGNLRESS